MSKSKIFPREVLKISSVSDNDLLSELGSLKLSNFQEKYGSNWRWAVFVHLMMLFKKLDIQNVDHESLAFTTSIRETCLDMNSSEEIELLFQAMYNLINKLCLTQISVTPLPVKNVEEKENYLII